MPKEWTGRAVGKMHVHGITNSDLAEELNMNKCYVSGILNSHKEPNGIQQRVEAAIDAIIQRRSAGQLEP